MANSLSISVLVRNAKKKMTHFRNRIMRGSFVLVAFSATSIDLKFNRNCLFRRNKTFLCYVFRVGGYDFFGNCKWTTDSTTVALEAFMEIDIVWAQVNL